MKITELPNLPDYILFSFQLPDVKMDGIAGFLITRLFQETIERALEKNGLLAGEIAMPFCNTLKARLLAEHNDYKAKMDKFISNSTQSAEQKQAGLAQLRQLSDYVARAVSGRPISMVRDGCQFYSSLLVSDIARALIVLEEELKRVAFLEWSKIGYYDAQDHVSRTYFPKNSNQNFTDHALAILKIFGLIQPRSP